ncbi:putative pre-16S rRNA nuclease [Insulibacter thermoxylanivorax]|uniref:Putative pre-16S rRNA nuclease n=1 Tax=Insulibacter thermoxylanivorax TaxID=2749268 RepID=A0A916QGB8_9BACL|nr:Holliday junction resolvase RuvX [Insulibacter thermoxylanivorax]GFR38923.1 putative pre-16S rRNA nuclease [Insulibacter thermoxylanivorax]
MRILGLDLGDKTIGVAVSDELGWTAQGVTVIRRQDEESDLEQLQELVDQYGVQKIVVGLPKNMDGSIGPRGEMCRAFAELLKVRFQLPVTMWDERLSTMAAERMLLEADTSRRKRKKVVDKIAASLILQGYLDYIRMR